MLRLGKIDLRGRQVIEVELLHVTDNADDGGGDIILIRKANRFPDGILAAPKLIDHGLIYDCDARRIGRVFRVEIAAAQKGNFHRVEKVSVAEIDLRAWYIGRRGGGTVRENHPRIGAIAADRQAHHFGCGHDSW